MTSGPSNQILIDKHCWNFVVVMLMNGFIASVLQPVPARSPDSIAVKKHIFSEFCNLSEEFEICHPFFDVDPEKGDVEDDLIADILFQRATQNAELLGIEVPIARRYQLLTMNLFLRRR